MNPISFKEQNRSPFKKPAGWTDEQCQSLPVHDDGEGMISVWALDDDDRARLAAGGPVFLRVIGRGHPPVSLATESPFVAPAKEEA